MILLVPICNWQFAMKCVTVVFGFDLWLDLELIFGSELYCIWTELQLTPEQLPWDTLFESFSDNQGGPLYTSSNASAPKYTVRKHSEKAHQESLKCLSVFIAMAKILIIS